MNRITATWRNGCFEKMDDQMVHSPHQTTTLPKWLFSLKLLFKSSLVREVFKYVSPPAATIFAFPSVFILRIPSTKYRLRCTGCQLRCLTLWWGADDVMLQILAEVCPSLRLLDLWKSARVTDQGLRSLLDQVRGMEEPEGIGPHFNTEGL